MSFLLFLQRRKKLQATTGTVKAALSAITLPKMSQTLRTGTKWEVIILGYSGSPVFAPAKEDGWVWDKGSIDYTKSTSYVSHFPGSNTFQISILAKPKFILCFSILPAYFAVQLLCCVIQFWGTTLLTLFFVWSKFITTNPHNSQHHRRQQLWNQSIPRKQQRKKGKLWRGESASRGKLEGCIVNHKWNRHGGLGEREPFKANQRLIDQALITLWCNRPPFTSVLLL